MKSVKEVCVMACRLIEKYVDCVRSTTQLACTGGAAAWEAKWLDSAVRPIQLYYSCIVNLGMYKLLLLFRFTAI